MNWHHEGESKEGMKNGSQVLAWANAQTVVPFTETDKPGETEGGFSSKEHI